MHRAILFGFLLFSTVAFSQTISASDQKTINNCVEYANRSADEVTSLFNHVKSYYSELPYYKSKKKRPGGFDCSIQLDESLFNMAIQESGSLAGASALNAKVQELHTAASKLDKLCKLLDTYHQLEDFKQDNFKHADELIRNMQSTMVEYRQKQRALGVELESVYRKLGGDAGTGPYASTNKMMRNEIARERAFLDLWNFNLEEDVHTGWPDDKLQTSILETNKAIAAFKQTKPSLKYPASSMVGSFIEALESMLTTKQSGLDGYNFDAKKSDRHSNEVYLSLINYFNGTMIADQNTFVQFSRQDGFYGLKSIQYVPLFDIRTENLKPNTEITPFTEVSHAPLKIIKQNVPIPGQVFAALSNYIDFINESLGQTDYLERILRNLNSSATYYKDLTTYKGKGGLTYDHKDFQIPLSVHQAAVTQSTAIPASYRKSLNDQADELLSILREMDQLSVALHVETSERRYEKDNLKRLYEILERYAVLFELTDAKKEQFYLDVRAISESYPVTNSGSSWIVSQKALLALVDEDRKQLFKAKAAYRGDSTSVPDPSRIQQQLREIITNEFTNMKGIERLGRYNGLCPYTPYEDIPNNSRTLAEKFSKFKSSKYSNYGGPDYDYVYLYNSIVGDYGKFCELSKLSLLRGIRQPELFFVKYGAKKSPAAEVVAVAAQQEVDKQPGSPVAMGSTVAGGKVIHDTIRVTDIIRIETRRQDTIYIEKHDTIYAGQPGGNFMSMEGYATNNLVFLLDVSGSMNAGQKLPLLKKSMLLLLSILRQEDRVSIVVYSGTAKVALPPTSASEREKITKVIEGLRSKGETDGNAGIRLSYKTADGNYLRGGNNRIVLATDGEFPISDETFKLAEKFSTQDIFLSVFNFSNDKSAARNLEKLSALGKGHYEYITPKNCDLKLIQEAKAKTRP